MKFALSWLKKFVGFDDTITWLSDKLRLCTIEYGAVEKLQVVCGTPNIMVGEKYPFATVDTTLSCGITLKKSKICGVGSLDILYTDQRYLQTRGRCVAKKGNSYQLCRKYRL